MNRLLLQLILILFFTSCISNKKQNETKIIESTKKYIENFYFKQNINSQIIDHQLKAYEKIDAIEMDSLLIAGYKGTLLSVVDKLQKNSNFNGLTFKEYLKLAGNTYSAQDYVESHKKHYGTNGFIAHFYSKYKLFDKNNNPLSNELFEDRQFLLSDQLEVIDIIK